MKDTLLKLLKKDYCWNDRNWKPLTRFLFWLSGAYWVGEPLYFRLKGRRYCVVHGWIGREDLNVHDMGHWD